jgi:hypothetical protein
MLCLAGLWFRQTNYEATTPRQISSTVELDSQFAAEDMWLVDITTSTLKIEDLNELPSFVLKALAIFFRSYTHTVMVALVSFFFHSCTLHRVHAVDFYLLIFLTIPVRTSKPCIF